MGAYDNPKIIQPPNYVEIFMKSFATSQALVKGAFSEKRKKEKEKEGKLDKAYDDTSKFRRLGGSINAGDLTVNIRRQANELADGFNANELAYIDEKIDRATYNANKDKYYGKLQSMVDIGGELSKIDIEKIDVSRYQPDGGKTLGLVEAWNNQAIDIDFNGDVPILFYSDPQDNRVNVTLGALKDLKPDDLGINTVFKIDKEDKKAFVDATAHVDIKGNFNGATYTLPDGEGRTVQIKAYEQGNYANADEVRAANKVYEENALNGIKTNVNQFYEGLDNDQKGSLFSDLAWASFTEGKSTGNKFRPGMKERFDELLNDPDLGLSDEDKKYIEKQILEGTYSGSDEQIAGMDLLSQNVLANQAFDNNFVKAPQEGVKQLSQDEIDRQFVRDQQAETSLQINQEKLNKEKSKPNKPIVDYTELTYGDVTTNSRANNIREFLISYDDLQLSQAKTPAALITILKNLDKNDLGIQRGENPYKNYYTVAELKRMMEEEPKMFTNTTNKLKHGINRGFKDKIESLPDDSYVNVGTVNIKDKTYIYAGTYWNESDADSTRKSRFQDLSGDNAGQMVDILKGFDGFGISKFKNVDPDVLISEVRLFIDNPRRFK